MPLVPFIVLSFMLVLTSFVGCASAPADRAGSEVAAVAPVNLNQPGFTFAVTEWIGGVGHALAMHGGHWHELVSSELHIVDPATLQSRFILPLGQRGRTGPATDMVIQGDRAWIVLEDDAVVAVDVTPNAIPDIAHRWSAAELGIEPRTIHELAGTIYVAGSGGVIALPDSLDDDPQHLFTTDGVALGVVRGARGLMTCVGRRVYALQDNSFVGSASSLTSLPARLVGGGGGFLFTRAAGDETQIGLMSTEVRERNAIDGVLSVPGTVRRVRLIDDRIWLVTDQRLICARIGTDRISRLFSVARADVHDVAFLNTNRVALTGAFGRAIVRPLPERQRELPGAILNVFRRPGGIRGARSDGRFAEAVVVDGRWLYREGTPVEFTPEIGPTPSTGQQLRAVTIDGVATIDTGRNELTITDTEGDATSVALDGRTPVCVVAVAGVFWVGHDRGVTILNPRNAAVIDELRLEGPVLLLQPLISGDGVMCVCAADGFCILRGTSSR